MTDFSKVPWHEPARQAEFARLVGQDDTQVNRICQREILTPGGTYQEWFRQYVKYMAAARRGLSGTGGDANLTQERAELTRVQKHIAEIQLLVKKGEFAPVDAISRQSSRIVSGIVTQLVAIPRELQKRHPEMTVAQIAQVQDIVSRACERAMQSALESLPLDEDEEEDA